MSNYHFIQNGRRQGFFVTGFWESWLLLSFGYLSGTLVQYLIHSYIKSLVKDEIELKFGEERLKLVNDLKLMNKLELKKLTPQEVDSKILQVLALTLIQTSVNQHVISKRFKKLSTNIKNERRNNLFQNSYRILYDSSIPIKYASSTSITRGGDINNIKDLIIDDERMTRDILRYVKKGKMYEIVNESIKKLIRKSLKIANSQRPIRVTQEIFVLVTLAYFKDLMKHVGFAFLAEEHIKYAYSLIPYIVKEHPKAIVAFMGLSVVAIQEIIIKFVLMSIFPGLAVTFVQRIQYSGVFTVLLAGILNSNPNIIPPLDYLRLLDSTQKDNNQIVLIQDSNPPKDAIYFDTHGEGKSTFYKLKTDNQQKLECEVEKKSNGRFFSKETTALHCNYREGLVFEEFENDVILKTMNDVKKFDETEMKDKVNKIIKSWDDKQIKSGPNEQLKIIDKTEHVKQFKTIESNKIKTIEGDKTKFKQITTTRPSKKSSRIKTFQQLMDETEAKRNEQCEVISDNKPKEFINTQAPRIKEAMLESPERVKEEIIKYIDF